MSTNPYTIDPDNPPEFIVRMIAKQKATKPIEYPIMVWNSFIEIEPHYASDGQFTGGLCTARWIRNGLIYEFITMDDKILEAYTYPIEYEKDI